LHATVHVEPTHLPVAALRGAAGAARDPEWLEVAAQARGLGSQALSRMLEGDLDNIAAKALRKDAAERYATPAAMADDLRRYLTEHATIACGFANVYTVQGRYDDADRELAVAAPFLKRTRGDVLGARSECWQAEAELALLRGQPDRALRARGGACRRAKRSGR